MSVVEGNDIFVQDFINQERRIADDETPSDIQKFFAGTTILVTGATGFMGKVLIEKLLRTCWRLEKLYLIIRNKKGKSPEERFSELFDGPLYERLKVEKPDYMEKVFAIAGDCSLPGLGLSEEDRQLILKEVDIIFHCAATVRFDETLRVAVNINMNGTKCILELGREMKNLKSLVHVSTAYSNCPRKEIEEKFYKPPIDYENVFQLINILEDKHINVMTPSLIGDWPNTYTFTKALSENLVRDLGKGLPVGIIRPSIVTSTAYEPVCGWINNYFGPQGVTVGAAMGLLRTLHCNKNVLADMVPVDLVINATIALAWDIGQTKGDNPNFEKISIKDTEEMASGGRSQNEKEADEFNETSDIPIVNYVSAEKRPIYWGEFMRMCHTHGEELGSMFAIWHCSITTEMTIVFLQKTRIYEFLRHEYSTSTLNSFTSILNSNYYIDQLYQILFHYIPAIIVDLVARLIGRKPIMWNAYKKISKFSQVISYFCTSQWKFHDDNVWKMWNKLSTRDKQLFNFNIEALEWDLYMGTYIRGLRVYITKDDMSTVPAAKKRMAKLKMLHYFVVSCVLLISAYFWWTVYRFFFS